jgi:hypothetical protein
VRDWLSPRFHPIGCLGAAVLVLLTAGGALGLVALLWWTVLSES